MYIYIYIYKSTEGMISKLLALLAMRKPYCESLQYQQKRGERQNVRHLIIKWNIA